MSTNKKDQQLSQTTVSGGFSFRRKQMLSWYRTADKTKFDDNNYRNWMRQVGVVKDMKEAIYLATEEQLDDLYILREELRLGI
jgi:translation initiation factor IF-3